jgi:hypothetical protein
MNLQQFRQSLKLKWLTYYRENRSWLTRIGVWVDCEGARRPSSSFILATLAVLEPQLTEMLPLIVDLSNNPDRIVIALGLNFSPESRMKDLDEMEPLTSKEPTRMLAGAQPDFPVTSDTFPNRISREQDEFCRGAYGRRLEEDG